MPVLPKHTRKAPRVVRMVHEKPSKSEKDRRRTTAVFALFGF